MRRNLSRPWTEQELSDLQKMLFEGRSLTAIAGKLRRTQSSVSTKISVLGWTGLRTRKRPARESKPAAARLH
jgi:hypothetical protein